MTAVPPNDDEFIRQLLTESGVDTSLPLQASLRQLRSAGTGPVPAPSAELAAFMAPAAVPLRRPRRAVRGAVIGLAIAAATGLGVSGVAAASPQFHAAADQAVRQVVGFFAPAGGGPAQPAPADTLPETTDQARPEPPVSGTGAPAADEPSPGPEQAPAAPAGAGTGTPAAPAGQDREDQAGERQDLPAPGLPVPTGLPGQGSGRSGTPGLEVPAAPRPAVPSGLPDLPDLPVLRDQGGHG
ncbi:hypothetical protein HER39_04935 [Arthrobacter deserti]|uniref:Anti-sigma factor n=1 Tax=Arthrobacter deserti TaxID=1742687 RepID=A0ABX1JKT6_9MICC|nr:hypothetical protein [Arthrobacter deserti]